MFHAADRVLVAIMNTKRAFHIACDEGWYWIPKQHAPASTTDATVLAFYFTRAFPKEHWAVHWYAEVRGHELTRRVDLFPDETEHRHALEHYYKVQIGPLIRREPPIPSLRWRRLTFIETTWDRFTAAEEVNDLYASGADGLYVTLKESGFFPEREYLIREASLEHTVDLAIPCQDGVVSIVMDDNAGPQDALHNPSQESIHKAVVRFGGPLTPSKTTRKK